MADYSRRQNVMGSQKDEPPNSRLFIVSSKSLTEEAFRNAFSEHGSIEEIWVVKDKATGENKGVTYIKFSKTSEAANALEALNGKVLGTSGRAIKVMIAASREQGSRREQNEEEKTQRLFIMVPKNMTDSELHEEFKQFGNLEYASTVKDRETKESKGFGYVKYYKFSHAAKAFENCDPKFKPVFAEPRKSRNVEEKIISSLQYGRGIGIAPPKRSHQGPEPLMSINPFDVEDGYTKLTVVGSPLLTQDAVWRLFDIVPGLDYCQTNYEGPPPRPMRSISEVVYNTAEWASHAAKKLHGFEYPIGCRLIVRPEFDNKRGSSFKKQKDQLSADSPAIRKIAETIAQASSMIKAAGLSPDILQSKLGIPLGATSTCSKDIESQCSIRLPDTQPMMDIDEDCEARCFIVCTPSALSNTVLKDVFCRFGNLIDVYMLTNRNCGYAKYATRASAEEAMKTLHGAEIMGIRIKVLEAEERPDMQRKRPRFDEAIDIDMDDMKNE